MNTCGPDAQPKKLPITHIFETPRWASLILQPSFPETYFMAIFGFSLNSFHISVYPKGMLFDSA